MSAPLSPDTIAKLADATACVLPWSDAGVYRLTPDVPLAAGLTARIHWLAITFRADVEDVAEWVASAVYGIATDTTGVLGDDPQSARTLFHKLEHGGKGYRCQLLGWHKVRIYFTPGRQDVHVVIPGEACEVAPLGRLTGLLACPSACCRRIDLALDGLERDGKPLEPHYLYTMAKKEPEKLRTRARLDTRAYHENDEGQTFTLGSRRSDRFLRVYDRRGFCRMELEVKGDKAERIGDVLADAKGDKLARMVVGLIREYIDFVHGDQKDVSARPLQGWWSDAVGDVAKVKAAVEREAMTAERKTRWVLKCGPVAAISALLTMAGGEASTLQWMVDKGMERMSARDRHLVAEFVSEREKATAAGRAVPGVCEPGGLFYECDRGL